MYSRFWTLYAAMKIEIHLPGDVAEHLSTRCNNLSRFALEALAVAAYRAGILSEEQLRSMLGFDSRFEVHAFLKQHETFLQYTDNDLRHDIKIARQD
jgi:hypothetical protein